MMDPHSSEIVVQAEIEYRRRQLITFRRSLPLEPSPQKSFRVTIAEALAHLALHLDGRSIGTVAAEHARESHHGHQGAA